LPDGTSFGFEIDPFARAMILAGTDEIGYVLGKMPAIEAWESTHPARVETRPEAATAR
jgi:3-isopropylmalate/(R)-2-methylmalate dehydratase small subunit